MKKFALWCGLAALAGAAFCVGEAGDKTLLVQGLNGLAVAPASLGRVKWLFQ